MLPVFYLYLIWVIFKGCLHFRKLSFLLQLWQIILLGVLVQVSHHGLLELGMHHCQALLAFKVSIEISSVILMSFLLYMSYFIFLHPLPLSQHSIHFVLYMSCSICNMAWGFFFSGLFGVLCAFSICVDLFCDFAKDLVYDFHLGFFYTYGLKLYCGHLYTIL